MAFFRLEVPFKDKDTAKSFGAQWLSSDKHWYFKGEELPEGLWKWYPGYSKVEGRPGVYLDTETGELLISSNGKRDHFDNEVLTMSEYESSDPGNGDYTKYRSVSEINRMISDIVFATNEFRCIFVKGEVTNFDGKKGRHYYFAIKDEEAVLPCVMWDSTAQYALKFVLEKGQQVAITGSLEYYKEHGKTQLIVSSIENIGEGRANLEYLRLKARLEAEGLFAPERKKPIPKHPERVGIITSKNGQAIKDICKVAQKRNPYVQLILFHVNVQGVNAVGTIVEGIKTLDKMGLDTIIVGRGGGSDEELNSYNDEKIARTVADAATPIVSAVGHQGHWTLIDFVADKRAATPSEAAEETIPDIMVDVRRVNLLLKGIRDNMAGLISRRELLLEARLTAIEKNSPANRLKQNREKLDRLSAQIDSSFRLFFKSYKSRFELLLAQLDGLSPTAKLVGGFGYVTKDGKAVQNASDVHRGDRINIRMHDGVIEAQAE